MQFLRNIPGASATLRHVTSSQTGVETAKSLEVETLEVPTLPFQSRAELPPGLTVTCISDTHSKHNKVLEGTPLTDVLIHCGDFTATGSAKGVYDFVDWFDRQPHATKIFIAGNHDTTLDTEYYVDRGAARFHPKAAFGDGGPLAYSKLCKDLVRGTGTCSYLEDSSVSLVTEGKEPLAVYGSPWQPEFCDWAFNLERGQSCLDMWRRIPLNTDVLLTHGPPYGFGDLTTDNFNCGCTDLRNVIEDMEIKPRVHIFGHIHEAYGTFFDGKTMYINASSCTFQYRPTNQPIIFHLPFDRSFGATCLSYDKDATSSEL